MSSDPNQRAEQIQANVAAALSRLRGEPADPVPATRAMAAPESGPAGDAGGQNVGEPTDQSLDAAPATLMADASLATDRDISAKRFGGDMLQENPEGLLSRLVRGGGTAEDQQPDLLAEIGAPPPPFPNLSDADSEMERDRRRKRNRMLAAAGVVLLALVALWFLIPADTGSDTVPLITAETSPEKIKPENEGGLQVPNQDVAILNEPDANAQAGAETLLPPPEQPVTPPNPAAAEPTTEIPAVAAPAPDEIPTVAAPETPAAAAETQAAATNDAAAQPSVDQSSPDQADTNQASDTTTQSSATQAAALPAVAGSVRVQLAAVKSKEAARKEWARLQKALPDLLGGLSLHIEQVDKGADGIFFRIQAGPLADRAAAKKLCADIKLQNQACIVAK